MSHTLCVERQVSAMTQHFRQRVMSAAQRPKNALQGAVRRAALELEERVAVLEDRLHSHEPLTEADEELLAAEYDRARGYDRQLNEQAKEAYQFSGPLVHWAPPSVRVRQHHV